MKEKRQLSRELGVQILFDADRLNGMKSVAVSGYLTPREALDKLLAGTNLQAQEEARDSFLIILKPSQALVPGPTAPDRAATTTQIKMDEVTVTGTHIRGALPVGAAVSTYDQDDFDQIGGTTAGSLTRYMLENFSGSDSLSTVNTNGNVGSLQQGAATNIFGGGGFDLLGLGSAATLTLLDGHRIAPGGLNGSMVDVSLIPWSAVDHIEVLTDGASAIYGSDAIAGVVNIVTRHALEGAQTSLRYGQSTEGGDGEFTGSQTVGHSWSTGNVLFDYQYDDQQGLDAAARSWIASENGPYSLIPENHRHSFFLSGNQTLAQTQFSFTGLYSTRGFQMSGLQLNTAGFIPDSETGGGHANLSWAAISVERDLPAAWHVSSSATYSSMNQWSSGSVFPKALGGDHYDSALFADSELAGIDVSAGGHLLHLPGGALRLALGGGLRSETFHGSVPSIEPLPSFSQNRTDLNAYAEATLPLFGERFSFPGARRLELSYAQRIDSYSRFGSDSNPKWGWIWEPTLGLVVRGTKATSFRVPLISQASAPTTSYTTLLPSDAPGVGPTDALVINGGGQYLEPEKSKSLTAGIDWAPPSLPQFQGSITYFNISYNDRIQFQNIGAVPLSAQPQLLSLTSFNPALSQVLPFFRPPAFQQDGAGLGPLGVNAIIDNQYANEESTVEQGVRINGQYTYEGKVLGRLRLSLAGNYLLVDRTSLAAYFPQAANVADTIAEPPKFRLRGGLTWQYNSLTADFIFNHTGSYQNTLFSPPQHIASWTTEDLSFKVDMPMQASTLWRGPSLVLNIQNFGDRRPPYLAIPAGDTAIGRSPVPFDGANASAVGRYISFELRKGWR